MILVVFLLRLALMSPAEAAPAHVVNRDAEGRANDYPICAGWARARKATG